MPGFQRSVFINGSVEDVFDFATNVANAPVLLPGVTNIDMPVTSDKVWAALRAAGVNE